MRQSPGADMDVLITLSSLCICIAIILYRLESNRWKPLPQLSERQADLRYIECHYDGLGSRLKRLGDLEIQYNAVDRPQSIGSLQIEYDMVGFRLKRMGHLEIQYHLVSHPTKLGHMKIEYDQWRGRIKRIGDFAIQYGLLGNIRSFGDFEFQYKMWSLQPQYLVTPKSHEPLIHQQLVALFAFYELTRQSRTQLNGRNY